MRSKIILAIMVALLSGETLAADPLPSVRFSELSWIPASPHQLQVLGLTLEASWAVLDRGRGSKPVIFIPIVSFCDGERSVCPLSASFSR
jgi:hypothetical protein